jgi:hypothetical protein
MVPSYSELETRFETLQKELLELREKTGRASPWRPQNWIDTITLLPAPISVALMVIGFGTSISSITASIVIVSIGLAGVLAYLGLESASLERSLNEIHLLYDQTIEVEEALFEKAIFRAVTSEEFRDLKRGRASG